MTRLTRTVRFCIHPSASGEPEAWGPAENTFAGYPSFRSLGSFYELEVACAGEIDESTGYLLNIKAIDDAVRAAAIPAIERAASGGAGAEAPAVLQGLLPGLNRELSGAVASVRWNLTPYYSIQMSPQNTASVLIRQNFDFAAAHRLHSTALSDAENQRVFGKCNNPRGHGHNYRVEPCVEVGLGAAGETLFGLADLERITLRTIIERFDHKHLNEDTAEFAAGTGVTPSVENIARVCFELLAPAIRGMGTGAVLRSITVWETEKTSATYPA